MKNKITLLLFALSFTSCQLLSIINKQEVHLKSATAPFDEAAPFTFFVSVDNKKVQMYFDTGASISFINRDSIVGPNSKVVQFGKINTAEGKNHKKLLAAVNFSTPWFDSSNKAVGVFPVARTCPSENDYAGVIGIDAFLDNPVMLQFDFDNNIISSFFEYDRHMLPLVGYEKIKCEISDQRIYIFPVIFGKERKLLLDTGNNGGLVLPPDEMPDTVPEENKIIIDGIAASSVSEKFGSSTIVYNKVPVSIGTITQKFPISAIGGHDLSNAGYEFIRQFNWIIDFEKKQIYIRKNNRNNDSSVLLLPNNYFSAIKNDQIEVVSVVRGNTDFKIGDIITSVDDVNISAQNICEVYKKLATTSWGAMKIITNAGK